MRKSQSDLLKIYEKLTYKKKTEILLIAIDYMQQYNGRDVKTCISLAMEDAY